VARAWAAEVLLDAGTSDPEGARTVLAAGASRVVVGLETLRAFRDLAGIVDAAGAERVVFSLDLRLGRGVLHPALQASGPAPGDPESLAARAVDSGVRTLLLLDVGRVGTGGGVDLPLVARLRRRFPLQRILAGGGVKGRADLERLRDAGCDGALVATAFHTGRLGAADVEAFTAPRSAAGQSRASTSR
jgi:phosphoribosylformimino-5-aminoimidazole carboxamide ribotide isomerase